MSIGVRFYSFSKKENSTKQPSGEGELMDCVLKNSCSILSPNLIVSTGSETAPSWNYCYIEAFSRFYFVSNWTWTNGLWSCDCAVDPMASWKSGIGASSQYVTRSTSDFDTYIKDDLYPIKANLSREETSIENLLTNYSNGTYILGVVGNDNNTLQLGSVCYYAMKAANLQVLTKALFNDSDLWTEAKRAYLNPLQYIVSCVWIPFNLYSAQNTTNLKLGDHVLQYASSSGDINVTAGIISNRYASSYSSCTIPKHPKNEEIGKYLNISPFSEYGIQGGAFGLISLDSTLLQDMEELYFSLHCDVATGRALLDIGGSVDNIARTVSIDNFNLGVPIQLAQSTSFDPSQIASLVSSTTGVATNLALGNVAGAIIGGAGMIGTAIDAARRNINKTGANGAFTIVASPPKLISTFYDISDTSNADRGRPLCKERRINTLSGYILCADAHLALPATAEEVANIKNIMEGGFFYE